MNEPTEQKYRCAICEGDHVTTFCPDALEDGEIFVEDDPSFNKTANLLLAISGQPYKCPVCKSNGTVYDRASDNDLECPECGGSGWLED